MPDATMDSAIDKEEPVTLTVKGRKAVSVTLKEASPNSPEHVGRVRLVDLGGRPGDSVTCHYGYGYMATSAITSCY